MTEIIFRFISNYVLYIYLERGNKIFSMILNAWILHSFNILWSLPILNLGFKWDENNFNFIAFLLVF